MNPNYSQRPGQEIRRPHMSRQEFSRTRYAAAPPRPRSIDGVAPVRRSDALIPASQDEYIDALANRASSRRTQFHDSENSSEVTNIFGLTIESLLDKAENPLKHIRNIKSMLPALGVIAVLIFSVLSIVGWQSDNQATANYKAAQEVDNGDTPSENPSYNQMNYRVADDQPRYLRIKKLGVDSRVVRLGVRSNSEPKFPTNIFDVGWYENSATPAESGTGLLIGHVSGETKNGVFYDLTSLVPGDAIELEDGKGRLHQYYVVKSTVYDRNNVNFEEALKSVDPERPGLNLMTAIGSFSKNSEQTQQLVVYAILDGVVPAGNGLIN